jgi:hypothetical protein
MTAPDPLTPIDCDCRGLQFMPLEVGRLIDSDLTALSTGDEFKAAVLLWAKSWTQVPAASLPDDDRILARMSGFNLADWRGLREMALKGWVKCSDGRLYHPLISDLAVKASLKRRGQSERANTRWARAKATRSASGMPTHQEADATAYEPDAVAYAPVMQGRGRVKEEPPTPLGGEGSLELEAEEPPGDPAGPDEVMVAFEMWNETAARCGLPKAKDLTDGRRRAIRKRLETGGLDGWREALGGVERSRHCRGGNDRAWKADLDFVCQAKSYQRLREGFYGDDADPAPPPVLVADASSLRFDPWYGRVREFALNRWWEEVNWGPKPGKAGCCASPAVLAEFGFGMGEEAA